MGVLNLHHRIDAVKGLCSHFNAVKLNGEIATNDWNTRLVDDNAVFVVKVAINRIWLFTILQVDDPVIFIIVVGNTGLISRPSVYDAVVGVRGIDHMVSSVEVRHEHLLKRLVSDREVQVTGLSVVERASH